MSTITHMGACELTVAPPWEDEPCGEWLRASCAEYNAAILAAGGMEKLHVWSSLTDLDGTHGSPYIFTEWGTGEWPVAACGGDPENRHPCGLDHAVFRIFPQNGDG